MASAAEDARDLVESRALDEDDENDEDRDEDRLDELNAAMDRANYDETLVDDDPETDSENYPGLHGGAATTTAFEPSYAVANAQPFFTFVQRLEHISQASNSKQKVPKQELLKYILPPKLLDIFHQGSSKSVYPLLRLLLPRRDGHRGNYNVKENKLAMAYAQAFDLKHEYKNKLLNYQDRTVCTKEEGLGNFPSVVQTVLEKELDETKSFVEKFNVDASKGYTVGQVNELLDELAGLQARIRLHNDTVVNPKDKLSQGKLLAQWLKKLNPYRDPESLTPRVWGLSPLEHKWINRIILGNFHIGLGDDVIMNWYNRASTSLWNAHNSLKAVCSKLVSPDYAKGFQTSGNDYENHDEDDIQQPCCNDYMVLPAQPITFNVPFVPMCSARTDFAKTLTLISTHHRKFQEQLTTSDFRECLALTHPAFTIETKLDGERQIVHFSRDGVVKIQSRRSNWYSELYSPVLGPPLRKAIGKHGFDIVLDGEILAWGGEQIGNQFGLNRSVANKRREWLESQGLIDDRDRNVHSGENEYKAMSIGTFPNVKSKSAGTLELDESVSGENVWLTYVVFDVVYLDGPGAEEFLNETVSKCIWPRPTAGSLISLSAMERRKILYRLVEEQENMVEIVDTQVVRPTGEMVNGRDYFRCNEPFMDPVANLPGFTVDSIECCLRGTVQMDEARRAGRSNEDLSQLRALQCDDVYRHTTDESRLEGIIFKDLASAYLLGEPSRDLRYWLKIKPDYTDGSLVSDIDVVIIGGYYATGLAKAGMPSAFLVACRDSMNPDKYFPFCRISAGSGGSSAELKVFFESTGYDEYNGNGDEIGNCKWFSSKEHRSHMPDFITPRSYQRSQYQADYDGWKSDKSTHPHIWIRPENSLIVTVKASEIISATTFPTGVTLRHPRIERFRGAGSGDEKDLSTIHCESRLRELYTDFMENRAKSNNSSTYASRASASQGIPSQRCLFLTEAQAVKGKRKQTKRQKKTSPRVEVATITQPPASRALEGVSFVILSGEFCLAASHTDCDLARQEGWYDEASVVSERLDVDNFIKSHGGSVKLQYGLDTLVLGGSRSDASVCFHVGAIQAARHFVANEKNAKLKTQNAKEMRKKAQLKGVIRWGFIYSAVYRWHRSFPESDSTIMATQPELLIPNALDYLARPLLPDHTELSQLCRLVLSDEIMMRRALEAVEEEDAGSASGKPSSWQYATMTRLVDKERWITRNMGGYDCGNMVLFPYPFGADAMDATQHFQSLSETDPKHNKDNAACVLSVLPLARTMGAVVSLTLHSGVTHVVSMMKKKQGSDDMEYSVDQLNLEDFPDPISTKKFIDLVKGMEREHNVSVKFVSPSWIRKRKRSWMP